MKKKILVIAIAALAIYGGFKGYKTVKAKGGLMSALGIKK